MRSVLVKAIVDSKATARYLRDVNSRLTQILEDIEEGVSECRDLADHYNVKVVYCPLFTCNSRYHNFTLG